VPEPAIVLTAQLAGLNGVRGSKRPRTGPRPARRAHGADRAALAVTDANQLVRESWLVEDPLVDDAVAAATY